MPIFVCQKIKIACGKTFSRIIITQAARKKQKKNGLRYVKICWGYAMETLFLHYIEAFRPVAYVAVFFGLILEGELVLFTALLLAHQGYLRLWELIPVALAGVFLGDYLWYRLGAYMANTQNRVTLLADKINKVFGRSVASQPLRLLTISKFTYGLHRSTLVSIGMRKVSPKTFLRADVMAVCFWFAVVGGAAFIASASFSLIKHYLKYTEIFLLVVVVAWHLLERLVKKLIENRKKTDSRAERNQINGV